MNNRTRAQLFVERFLADLEADATVKFKDELQSAVELLLDEAVDDAVEDVPVDELPGVLVWAKVPKVDDSVPADVVQLRATGDATS